MASMQYYKEEGKEFDYYSYEKSSGNYQKPTNHSTSGYEQSYYEKEKCYENKPGMMGYGSAPMGGALGYGNGHNSTHGMMGYGNTHNSHGYGNNHHMHKPGFINGLGSLGHVVGFGKKHEGHGSYGMGSSGCTTYKKQHHRRKGMGGYKSGSDCSDSSDDERHC